MAGKQAATAVKISPVKGDATGEMAATIRDLVSYRVSRAAGLMSRSAALRFRRESDVSLGEWRTIALLAASPAMSLMQLARESGLDKAQTSRVVTSLIARGLVTRCPSPAGRRAVELNLSEEGQQRYAALIEAARERDHAFRAALSDEQLTVLLEALDILSRTAKGFITEEAAFGED